MFTRFPILTLLTFGFFASLLLISCSGSSPVSPSNAADADTNAFLDAPISLTPVSINDEDYDPFPWSADEVEPYAPDEVLVTLNEDLIPQNDTGGLYPGVSARAISVLAQHGLSLREAIDAGWTTVYRLRIHDGSSVMDKIAELEELPIIDIAEPNITFTFCDVPYTPNDPFWENPDDSDEDPRTVVREQFGPSKIGASTLWAESTVGQEIIVCVLDSGIQVWHEDLENVMWINEDEIPDNGIDDDVNGYIDDIYGWDMYDNDNDITEYNGDEYYHGTSCAGVVAAEMDNELGCAGIAPGAKIMGVRIGFGYTYLSIVLSGVAYARKNGADIINMSFGGDEYSPLFNSALEIAWDEGLLLVGAAGNDDSTGPHYPSGYESVICVGGTIPFGKRWNYAPIDEIRISEAAGYFWGSNYGFAQEVMAFGEFYITARGENDHRYYDGVNDNFFRGTSCATPMVSGALALVKSMHPGQTNEWLRERIRYMADDIDVPGYDQQTGQGRINVVRAAYGLDRYEMEEDGNGFVDIAPHDNQVIDSIHAVAAPYTDTDDYYKITATETGHLTFYLDIWTWGEDIDLFLYSSPALDSGSIIDQSVGENHAINSFEVAGTACEAGETIYIRIKPGGLGDSSAYTLTAEYVEPGLQLEIETYDPGFTHLSRSNVLLGHLDFSSNLTTRITGINFSLSGSMPVEKLTELSLYKDTYVNGTYDSLDQHVADAVLNGTNRAVFSGMYEEIAGSLSPVRYFLFSDISGVIEDAIYELVLTSYKDVSTYEGVEIAYDSFPYTFGPYEVGVDIEAPIWPTTTGVQETRPRYRAAGLFWNSATDERTPPVEYNVYWATELPFEYSTVLSETDVGFWDGGDYDHRWVIPDLENFQEYYVAVRAIDQAGNEDENTVYMSVIPDDTPDPTWPQLVGVFNTDGDAKEVKADPANQRVFVADNNGGLVIVDISNPLEPALINSLEASGVLGVDYDGTYAYVAAGSGLLIVDPDDAEGPEVVSSVDFASALRVLLVGNWAYVTKLGTELLPVDITDPLIPVAHPTVTTGDSGYALYEQDGYLYDATFQSPRVFDLVDPSAPVEVVSFGATQGHDALAIGDRLYIAIWNERRAYVYDIIDPTAPAQLGYRQSNSGYRGSGVVMFGGYLYFGTQSWGIEVLDVTDPAAIVEVGQMYTNGPDGMDTDGYFIYSAENEHGLKIIM